ncbi:hypothetical protein Bca52824_003546 [Brassica carinata]|uniref:Uncharacterized protein n=1 Tax=Brassica carinata TaxID=52824 RepID=A0A8X7WMB5_BRACI|nr:hypothetical protein Bca52824_003546 [Brassica carinata]
MSLDVNRAYSVGLGGSTDALVNQVDGWFGRECTLASSCNEEGELTIKESERGEKTPLLNMHKAQMQFY